MRNAEGKTGENILQVKTYKFALPTVKLYKHLMGDKKDFVLSKRVFTFANFDWRMFLRKSRRVENGFCS